MVPEQWLQTGCRSSDTGTGGRGGVEASARGIRSWRLHWGPTLARGGVPLTWASPGGNNIILERRPAPRGVASVRRRGAAVAGPEEDAAPRCRALVPRAETHYGHPWGLRGQHLRPQRGGNGWRAGSSGNNRSCTVLAWAATVVHVSRLGALHFGGPGIPLNLAWWDSAKKMLVGSTWQEWP